MPWLLEDVGEYCRWKRNKNRMQLEDEDADLRATKEKKLGGQRLGKGRHVWLRHRKTLRMRPIEIH